MRIEPTLSRISAFAGLVTLLSSGSTWAGGPPAPEDLVKPGLAAETASISAEATLWVDLHLAVKPGWHVYWQNPGDSGLPTSIDWKLPPDFSPGPINWPVPEHFVQNGIGNYGYAGIVDLLVPINVPNTSAPGQTALFEAEASWLSCSDICIPGGQNLSLSLPIAERSAPDPSTAQLFAAARRHLPAPAPFETRFASTGSYFRLVVPSSAVAQMRNPTGMFFPVKESLIDAAAKPRTERDSDGLAILLPKASDVRSAPATLDGVLSLRGEDGAERAFEISANPIPGVPAEGGIVWWQALLLAFLGGVVLNAMPCVFPILSLKLLSVAQQAHGHRSERRKRGF